MKSLNELGVFVPKILLPSKNVDIQKWPVIACDQYTNQEEYWNNLTQLVGKSESSLHLIFPDIYLENPGFAERVKKIHYNMNKYSADQVLEEKIGFILVERTLPNGDKRIGLMLAIDLELYDYLPSVRSLIRPTEDTIVTKIPTRVDIRRQASLELPHVLLLVDDKKKSVIEPIYQECHKFEVVYDTDLPMNAGHVKGYLIPKEYEEHLKNSLNIIADQNIDKSHPFLFAVGDGNQSLASAKAYWNEIKKYCEKDHNARFALVELINVYSPSLNIKPIHRVVLNIEKKTFLEELLFFFKARGSKISVLSNLLKAADNCNLFHFLYGQESFSIEVEPALPGLETGIIQEFIEAFIRKHPTSKIEYTHGAQAVKELVAKGNNMGILLPEVDKTKLLTYIDKNGPLPKKFFSLGEPDEKRFYLEARRIK